MKIVFFMDFSNVSTLSACALLVRANFLDKIDEFWLLDHIFSSKTRKVHLGWSPTWFLHRELFFENHRPFLTSSFKALSEVFVFTSLIFFGNEIEGQFFSMKAVMLIFSNLKPRRPQRGVPKLYFSLIFFSKKRWNNNKYGTSENVCRRPLWWKIRYKT